MYSGKKQGRTCDFGREKEIKEEGEFEENEKNENTSCQDCMKMMRRTHPRGWSCVLWEWQEGGAPYVNSSRRNQVGMHYGMMVKMEMCLLMNLANIYDNGSFSISFSEGEGALMKKCVIWIIPTMSPGHFKRRGNIFSSVLDMDILEWKMLWKPKRG